MQQPEPQPEPEQREYSRDGQRQKGAHENGLQSSATVHVIAFPTAAGAAPMQTWDEEGWDDRGEAAIGLG